MQSRNEACTHYMRQFKIPAALYNFCSDIKLAVGRRVTLNRAEENIFLGGNYAEDISSWSFVFIQKTWNVYLSYTNLKYDTSEIEFKNFISKYMFMIYLNTSHLLWILLTR